jgi:uncharacterized protein (TIGR01777 family)
MRTIVVTGGTGMVGKPIVAALQAAGDRVVALVRDEARARPALGPDVELITAPTLEEPGPWTAALTGADAVLHLAGEPIAGKRWNAQVKQHIRDSRVESTRVIVEAIAALPAAQRPGVLVTASGADYYGFANRQLDDDDEITERDPAGDAFLARVCAAWEHEAARAEPLGLRVVRMRSGVIIGAASDGGALAKMTTPFKLFAGGRIGSGEQWFSWISLADAVAAYVAALTDPRYTGPLNLVAPETVRNAELATSLGKVLHRPSWLPVPAFALRWAVGELAEYLLEGRRVVPAGLLALGFPFRHPTLAAALTTALSG